MNELHTVRELDSRIAEETVVIYKHSTRCPISAAANKQLERFLEQNPEAPLYKVDVHASADVSDYIVEKTGIEHQSPQLILFRGGEPVWSATHSSITADALAEKLAS